MSEDSKNKADIKDQLKDFTDHEMESNSMIGWIVLLVAVSGATLIHTLTSVVSMATDDSIPLVVCPRTYDLDKPVIMNTILETNKLYVQDRWIRGFTRSFVMSLFPRTDKDVETMFTYIRDHSEDAVRYKYQGFLDSEKEIKKIIASGQMIKFYPKTGNGLRIRPTQESGNQTEWVVEVDGYLNKGYSNSTERTLPTIRMKVKASTATQTNPEGLIVTELNVDDSILDLVSGRKKHIKTEEEIEAEKGK